MNERRKAGMTVAALLAVTVAGLLACALPTRAADPDTTSRELWRNAVKADGTIDREKIVLGGTSVTNTIATTAATHTIVVADGVITSWAVSPN